MIDALQKELTQIEAEIQTLGSRRYLAPRDDARGLHLVIRRELLHRALDCWQSRSLERHILKPANPPELV